MARTARPWYFTEKQFYAAVVKGRRVILLKGEENDVNAELAAKKLKQILKGTKNEPQAHGGVTAAEIIERYLRLSQSKYSERAFSERRRYLQMFAEAHGWRKVNDKDCLPVHVEEWIADHPEWKSNWTTAQIISMVMRPFNWAAKKRLIPANPFRGVEKGQGEPRRPITDAEFRQLLIHATVWKKRKRPRKVYPCERDRRQRPSAGARFRQVLIFLRFTGMRPGEMSGLQWADIDLDAKEIVLRKHKTAKKTGRVRRIPIHPVVLKLLIAIRRLDQPGEFVFLNHRKNPWNRSSLSLGVQRAREAAGISEM